MRLAPKLLSAGLVALSSSPSDAHQTQQLRGLPVVRNNNVEDRCRDGEEYMVIKAVSSLTGVDNYTITWRQLTDACKRPVFPGFEATGYLATADEGDQGKLHFAPFPDEDGRSLVSINTCAPHGYYELEISVEGDSIDTSDNSRDIQWEIDAGPHEYFMSRKWTGRTQRSAINHDNSRKTATGQQASSTWLLQHDANSQIEHMWSGSEPQACEETNEGGLLDIGNKASRNLQVAPTVATVGCYPYTDVMSAFFKAYSTSVSDEEMSNMICAVECDKLGQTVSATKTDSSTSDCYCGMIEPTSTAAPNLCDRACPAYTPDICGGDTAVTVLKVTSTNNYEVPGVESSVSTHLGCFSKPNDGDDFTTTVQVDAGMTNSVCQTECVALGNQYSATMGKTDCLCGDSEPVPTTLQLSECNKVCGGDSSSSPGVACGGNTHMSVYDSGSDPDTMVPPPGDDMDDASYMGCFLQAGNVWFTDPAMTIELCKEECVKLGNMRFSTTGTDGTGCICGDTAPTGDYQTSACNIACPGNDGFACGSGSHMSAYELLEAPDPSDLPTVETVQPTTANAPDLVNYHGCFDVGDIGATDPTTHVYIDEDMTNEECRDECVALGYQVFATKSETECLCAVAPPGNYNIQQSMCNGECGGSSGEACGGSGGNSDYVSLYSVFADPTATFKFLTESYDSDAIHQGCFKSTDLDGFVLSRTIAAMTNEDCMEECSAGGFTLAATTKGNACYCGLESDLPPAGTSIQLTNCNFACGGGPESPMIPWACGDKDGDYANLYAFKSPTTGSLLHTESVGGANPVGCISAADISFLDTPPQQPMFIDSEMDNEMCREECYALGNKYFATTGGDGCLCGNIDPGVTVDDIHRSKCDAPCKGKNDNACGSTESDYVNLYSSTGNPMNTVLVTVEVVDGSIHQGCFAITDLPSNFPTTAVYTSPDMTNELCATECLKIGKRGSATIDGTDCLCGSYPPPGPRTNIQLSKCNKQCGGSLSDVLEHFACGSDSTIGEKHVSLYTLHMPTDPASSLPDASKDVNHVGCVNVEDDTGFPKMPTFTDTDMTNQLCKRECQQLSKPFSATAKSTDCYCLDAHPGSDIQQSGCTAYCGGAVEACGGVNPDHVSLFTVDTTTGGLNLPPTDGPPMGSKHLGCFNVNHMEPVFIDSAMNAQLCKDECGALGQKIFATTESTACICAGNIAPNADVHLSACNAECGDGSGNSCGSKDGKYMNLYRNDGGVGGSKVVTEGGEGFNSTHKGCFKVDGSGGFPTTAVYIDDAMTNTKCRDDCKKLGKSVFATTGIAGNAGKECLCGNRVPRTNIQLSKCNTKCGGDTVPLGASCGGVSGDTKYMDLFEMDMDAPQSTVPDTETFSDASYEGCYSVDRNTMNSEPFAKEWTYDHMTNEKCRIKCEARGEWYFATSEGKVCLCGDDPPEGNTHVSQCCESCAGGEEFACGGRNYMTVYKLEAPVDDTNVTKPASVHDATYKGCFKVSGNGAIPTDPVWTYPRMTNEKCRIRCEDQGDWVFATTKGSDCLCGDEVPATYSDPWGCYTRCNGNSGEECGGDAYMSVFKLNDEVIAETLPATSEIEGATHKGCFKVNGNGAIPTTPIWTSRRMTNEVCKEECVYRKQWVFATTKGSDCLCGDYLPYTYNNILKCDTPCKGDTGDTDEACGGDEWMTVFKVDAPTVGSSPPTSTFDDATFKGCFRVSGNDAIPTTPVQVYGAMTNLLCKKECKSRGLWVFATTNGKDCLCGDEIPHTYFSSRDPWDCETECKGDDAAVCGGDGYMSVYKIRENWPVDPTWPTDPTWPVAPTWPTDPTWPSDPAWPNDPTWPSDPAWPNDPTWPKVDTVDDATYKGCYQVRDNHAIPTTAVWTYGTMTNKLCKNKCRSLGLSVFATTKGSDCLCGDEVPDTYSEPWECHTACKGNAGVECGGDYYMSVFWVEKGRPKYDTGMSYDEVEGAYAKGCFEDSAHKRVLGGYSFHSESMTAKTCGLECRKRKYGVFGTQYSKECYCGRQVPHGDGHADKCDYPCMGNRYVACGGSSRINVYEWEDSYSDYYHEPSSDAYHEPSSDDYHAKGCFRDSTKERVLKGHDFKSDKMTTKECARVCKEKHFNVFGTEFGRECFCGDNVPKGEGNADKCEKECAGDGYEICGGHNRINIYEFAGGYESPSSNDGRPSLKDDAVEGAHALGCYEDDSHNRVLGEHSFVDKTGMTAEICGHVCYEKGFDVFGTEFGRECFCGKHVPDSDWKADKCDSACTGNEWVACGGRNRINIFKWVSGYGESEPDSRPDYGATLHQDTYYGATYLGCYEDSKKHRVLDEDRKVDQGMTTQSCGDYCKGHGYAYFGTEYSTECFCGNYFHEDKVYDSQCDRPCAGKKSTICGGHSRISVYECDHHSSYDDGDGHHSPYDDYVMVEPKPEHMLGCFKDTTTHRVLNIKAEYKLNDMTPEKCYWYCKAVHGAMYYGVEYGKECFCGDRESTYYEHPLDEHSCKTPCPGDKTRHCGGSYAINVYGPPRSSY